MDDQDDRLLLRRKVFDSDLVKYVGEASAQRPVALVMLDLDKFKAVNDSHGHPLPNYSPEEALALAERLRRALESGTWTSKQLKVTGSLGVAVAPALAPNAPDLLRLADAALYEAKDFGRNYVRLAGEPRPVAPQPRQPDRRAPEPGGMSEAQMEELRLRYHKRGRALCPKDGVPLKVQKTTGFGFKSPGLYMECLACGFEVQIPGIAVAKSEG